MNRIDEIIIFNRLKKEDINKIVDIQLDILRNRLQDKHIDIELTKKGKDFLGEQGFDPVYGARPLKRTIQRLVQNPLAIRLLKGEIKEKSRVKIDKGQDGELQFAVSKN